MTTDRLTRVCETSISHKITNEVEQGTFFIDDDMNAYFMRSSGELLPPETLTDHYLIDFTPVAKALGFSRTDRRKAERKAAKLERK